MSQVRTRDLTPSWTGLIFYVYLFCEKLFVLYRGLLRHVCNAGVTSINIALTLALDVRLFIFFSAQLTARAERVRCNGIPVRFPFNHGRGSSLKVNNRAQSAIHSVLTTRIVLNIREAASQRLQDHSFDLHLSETESQACRSQIRFADRQVVLYSSDEQMRDTFGRGEGHGDSGASIGGVEVASISTRTTISHITLPMARGAKGGGVVGQFEPGEDDDMDSINTFLDEWV